MTKYINGVEIQGTVTDSITTSANNTGTITIGADLTRGIDTNGGNILKQVLFNGVSNVTSIDAAANVTVAELITDAVSYTARRYFECWNSR
jgi:hypothetical protein